MLQTCLQQWAQDEPKPPGAYEITGPGPQGGQLYRCHQPKPEGCDLATTARNGKDACWLPVPELDLTEYMLQ